MNRPGQPQQRPPNLAPTPSLTGQYRPPYPNYGMPPRNVNVLQGGGYIPGLQQNNHRTPTQQAQAQSMVPQPTPFIQQRSQNSFPFGGGLGQHQPSTPLQQQQQQPLPSQQQHQTNGTSNTLLPHLAQTPSLGTAPSASSTSEVGLDPNDFPALGSAPANNSNSTSGNNGNASGVTTSYASQAGTGVPLGGAGATVGGTSGIGGAVGGTGSANQPRDFTPDDFPALGGQTQNQNPASHPPQSQTQDSHAHPPGLNGFQHTDPSQQQHRQSLLGSLGGTMQPGTPGMLNLGARNVHPGFQQGQTEAEKQQQRNNYALKLNQATHAAWNSPNSGHQSQTAGGSSGVVGLGLGTGAFSNPPPQATTQQQNGSHPNQNSSATLLNAPPGVPPPTSSYVQQQQPQQSSHTHGPGTIANASATPATGSAPPYASNGLTTGDPHVNPSQNPNSISNPNPHPNANPTTNSLQPNSHPQQQHPQTPAQQVLMSAADRWGLLGLLAMIKNAGTDVDQGLSSVGTDLGTMGLDMGYAGNLYPTFITPWADQSAAHTVEPDFHLPACYNVQPPPPGPTKAQAFGDETLFFMFYSSPRDALQEVAAQELWNRNWRYHKELRLWITKESGTSPSQKVSGGEQGQYTFWDPENWGKERKEMTVLYADLEEKNVPVFVAGPGLVLAQSTTAPGQTVGQQAPPTSQQLQQQGQVGQVQQGQVQPSQRGSFPMGIAGL